MRGREFLRPLITWHLWACANWMLIRLKTELVPISWNSTRAAQRLSTGYGVCAELFLLPRKCLTHESCTCILRATGSMSVQDFSWCSLIIPWVVYLSFVFTTLFPFFICFGYYTLHMTSYGGGGVVLRWPCSVANLLNPLRALIHIIMSPPELATVVIHICRHQSSPPRSVCHTPGSSLFFHFLLSSPPPGLFGSASHPAAIGGPSVDISG